MVRCYKSDDLPTPAFEVESVCRADELQSNNLAEGTSHSEVTINYSELGFFLGALSPLQVTSM